MASALFISRNTVVDHIRNIRAKYTLLGRDVALIGFDASEWAKKLG